MNYALIENGIVVNIIWIHPINAGEFTNAVFTNNLPVQIGDTYTAGKFYRNGNEVVHREPDNEQAVVDSIMQEVSSYGY